MPTPQPDAPPLDLRATKCPLNFVKAKLALEKLPIGGLLEVWIASTGESAINIPQSMVQEGHEVVAAETEASGRQRLFIRRKR